MSRPECCSSPPALNPISGASYIEKVGSLNSFVTGPSYSNSTILLISYAFGTFVSFLTSLSQSSFFTSISFLCFVQLFCSIALNERRRGRRKRLILPILWVPVSIKKSIKHAESSNTRSNLNKITKCFQSSDYYAKKKV